jgi:hypothetical protein
VVTVPMYVCTYVGILFLQILMISIKASSSKNAHFPEQVSDVMSLYMYMYVCICIYVCMYVYLCM